MQKFLIAVGFLTKVPIPKKTEIDDKNLVKAMAYFPLVGLLLGISLVLVNCLLTPFLPQSLLNLVLISLLILMTGALHIDGLADTVDGFCSKAKTKEDILNIMRDSRIGVMGVIAVVLVILFKYELLNTIQSSAKNIALILMCSISRWSQVEVSYLSKYARGTEGLGKPFIGNVGKRELYLAAASIVLISLVVWFPKGLLVLFFASLIAWLIMRYAHRKIGGLTGDTVGAISEIIEVFVLLWLNQ